MSAVSEKAAVSPSEFRRAWRIVSFAGALGTIWGTICVGSPARTKFLIELHASPFHIGLIAFIGSIALAFQLFSGIMASRIRYRKKLWMGLTIVHRALFLAVLASPVLFVGNDSFRLWWIIGVLFLHDSLMNFGTPLWFSWMADLVPQGSMNRYWANRQRFTWTVNIGASLAMAFGFDYFEKSHQVVLGYAIIGASGVLLGIIDILMFAWVPDVPNESSSQASILETLVEPLRDSNFRRYTFFLCFWMFSVMLSAPFMPVYQMEVMGMSVLTVQLILVINFVSVAFISRFWGLISDAYGQKPVIIICTFGKAFIVLAFLLAPNVNMISIPLLSVIMFLDGLAGGGIILALQSYLFKFSPRRSRAMYISSSNFFQGIAAGVAPLLAGKLIVLLDKNPAAHMGVYAFTGYHVIFLVSFILRLVSVYFAMRLHEPQSVPLRTIFSHLCATNPFRVVRAVYRLSESTNMAERLQACHRLGNLRSPLAIGELIAALEDPDRKIRQAAADALGTIGRGEASEPLARALMDHDRDIQTPAARALGRIGDYNSLKALLGNLDKLEPKVLGEIIDSLEKIGDSAAILPLICLFEKLEDENLRRKVARTLGMLSETESEDEVLSMLAGGRTREPRSIEGVQY